MFTKKDWIDLLLMVIGALIGVGVIGFVVGPVVGFDFNPEKPIGYMLAAATGTVCGYLLRWSVQRLLA